NARDGGLEDGSKATSRPTGSPRIIPWGERAPVSGSKTQGSASPPPRQRRLERSTAIFALATGLSRVLALVREMVAAYYFGAARGRVPRVALLGVSGIVVGILNTYEHFTVPALSPVFWTVAIIVGSVIGVPEADSMSTKLFVYAASILVATVIQTLLPLPW